MSPVLKGLSDGADSKRRERERALESGEGQLACQGGSLSSTGENPRRIMIYNLAKV
jgi:hypothetical protein